MLRDTVTYDIQAVYPMGAAAARPAAARRDSHTGTASPGTAHHRPSTTSPEGATK